MALQYATYKGLHSHKRFGRIIGCFGFYLLLSSLCQRRSWNVGIIIWFVKIDLFVFININNYFYWQFDGTWLFVFGFYASDIFVILSGIHASLTLILHCHYLKESLHVNFSRKALEYIGDFGIVGFVSGLALMLFYTFLEIYYKAGM